EPRIPRVPGSAAVPAPGGPSAHGREHHGRSDGQGGGATDRDVGRAAVPAGLGEVLGAPAGGLDLVGPTGRGGPGSRSGRIGRVGRVGRVRRRLGVLVAVAVVLDRRLVGGGRDLLLGRSGRLGSRS